MATSYTPDIKSQPLAGIRVVEIGLFHAGPTAAAMLGALGAEVIKVEDPKSVDPVRAIKRVYGQDCTLPGGRTSPFEAYNGGKKGITISLKHAEGKRAFDALIAKSDVFLHNMRAETATRLKIDYDSLIKVNPKLVFATISGFGPQGADSARPGLDPVGLARSGTMTVLSGGSKRPPILPAAGVADRVSGMLMGYGILAALIARDRTGEPQRVDGSLIGGALWLGQLNLQYALFKDSELFPTDHTQDPLLNCYQCSDARWIFIGALTPEGFPALCGGLELPELVKDARFNTNDARWDNRADFVKILIARFASQGSDYWLASFAKQPALIFERVQRPTDIANDPQLLANNYLVELDHPDIGRKKRIAFPLHVNGKPAGRVGPAPGHGEHTDEVLGSLLGMSAAEIAALHKAGAA